MPRSRTSLPARPVAVATVVGLALGLVATAGVAAPLSVPGAASASGAFASPARTEVVGPSGADALNAISVSAAASLAEARAVLASASAVDAEVAAPGVADRMTSTTVERTDLRERAERMSGLDLVPTLLLSDATAQLQSETRVVQTRLALVRAALDTAREAEAAEKAAAEAQRQAEAAAAAEAQRQADVAAALARVNTPDGAKTFAQQRAASEYGWGAEEFSCLTSLWDRESGWDFQAYNSSSGATGIPQALPGGKMASAGADWQTNAATQIAWGLDYISRGFGSPCAAWSHSQSTGWY